MASSPPGISSPRSTRSRTTLLEQIRAAGCEVGLHGIKHDCKLFESRANFEAELPAIHRYLAEWDAAGFRSPATHRNPDWMPELGSLYDSSFPDTDPFEPQPGGCCSILPYFLEQMVELPITLVQDHTLWEILRQDTIELWTSKSDWIIANGGLVNLITHPDYLDRPRAPADVRRVPRVPGHPAGTDGTPCPVRWPNGGSPAPDCDCVEDASGARIEGDGAERATLAWARRSGDGVALEPETCAI